MRVSNSPILSILTSKVALLLFKEPSFSRSVASSIANLSNKVITSVTPLESYKLNVQLIHSIWYIHGVPLYVDRAIIAISFVETSGKHNVVIRGALGSRLAEVFAEGRGDSPDSWQKVELLKTESWH